MTFACSIHPTRIDFNLMPAPPSSGSGELSFAQIEDTGQLHAELARLIEFVGGHLLSDSINRVGVFLHFIELASNITEANKLLTAVIPNQYRMQIADEEDFILQINRPQLSQRVQDVKMNYVTKWSVDRFQVLNIPIPISAPGLGLTGGSFSQRRDFIGASVVFDYNNVPVTGSLTREQQASLLQEGLKGSDEMQQSIGLGIEGF